MAEKKLKGEVRSTAFKKAGRYSPTRNLTKSEGQKAAKKQKAAADHKATSKKRGYSPQRKAGAAGKAQRRLGPGKNVSAGGGKLSSVGFVNKTKSVKSKGLKKAGAKKSTTKGPSAKTLKKK